MEDQKRSDYEEIKFDSQDKSNDQQKNVENTSNIGKEKYTINNSEILTIVNNIKCSNYVNDCVTSANYSKEIPYVDIPITTTYYDTEKINIENNNYNIFNGDCTTTNDDTFDESNFNYRKKEVIEWMITRESQEPYGGIIAADMGTVDYKMSIIMDLLLKSKNHKMNYIQSEGETDLDETIYEQGHTLIICSKTKIHEWIVWIQEKNSLDIVCFHNRKSRKLSLESLTQKNIVITTITSIHSGFKNKEINPLYQITWDRIILDNALCTYNYKLQIFKALCNLSSISRWALIGSNFDDNDQKSIYSLIKYINYKPLSHFEIWKKWSNKDPTVSIKKKFQHIIFNERIL